MNYPAPVDPPSLNALGAGDFAALAASMTFAPYTGDPALLTQLAVVGTGLEPLTSSADLIQVRPFADGETLIDGGLYCVSRPDGQLVTRILRYLVDTWYWECNNSIGVLNWTVTSAVVAILSGAAPAPLPPATSTGLNVGNLVAPLPYTLA